MVAIAAKRGANIVADIKSENIDIAMREIRNKNHKPLIE
jgi:hypothetical protein